MRCLEAANLLGASGDRVRTVPFEYCMAEHGRRLEEDPAEQDILVRIRELKAAGRTTRQIADELKRPGCTKRRGTQWRFQYVAKALRGGARGGQVKKQTVKPKKGQKKDQAWFERKVAELGAKLEKLPADRQKQLERELKQDKS
jgi:hypothetical protein